MIKGNGGLEMKIAIRQVRGGSGIDVWAENLCGGIRLQGHECKLDLQPPLYQIFPALARLHPAKSGYSLIQSNTWNGFAFKNDVPLVVTEHHVVHDLTFHSHKTIPQVIYHRWIFHCELKSLDVADAVICVSEFTRNQLETAFGFSDARVIYNGVDTSIFRPIDTVQSRLDVPAGKYTIFFAGNLSKRKGGDLLPLIMRELGEQYILIIASGQTGNSLSGSKNTLNLGHISQEQLIEVYNQCDVFLSPSRLEGFGLSIAEAMSCGKPVVATNCSAIPELVIDGKGGFLCGMDDVKDFAEKIRYLAADEELRTKMGAFNRKRVEEKFELSRMVRDYINLYQSL